MRVSDAASRGKLPIEVVLIELMLGDPSQIAPRWYVRPSGLTRHEWWVSVDDGDVASPEDPIRMAHEFWEARSGWEEALFYRPRTRLGRRLWAIRQRILRSGAKPLTAEEVSQELALRRGERSRE